MRRRNSSCLWSFALGLIFSIKPSFAAPPAEAGEVPDGRYLAFYGGISVPIGEYSSASGSSGGSAGPGLLLGMGMTAKLGGSWNIGVSGEFLGHPYRNSLRQAAYRDTLPLYSIHAGSYLSLTLLTRIGYDVPVSDHILIGGRGLVGIFLGQRPEIREDNITARGSGRRTTSAAFALAPTWGVRIETSFFDRWDISVGVATVTLSYHLNVHEAHGTTPTAYRTETIKQPISRIEVTVGYLIH